MLSEEAPQPEPVAQVIEPKSTLVRDIPVSDPNLPHHATPSTPDQSVWARVVRACGQTNPILRAILTNSTLLGLENGSALLTCSERFAVGAKKHQAAIAQAFERELGRPIVVEFRDALGVPAAGATGGNSETAPGSATDGVSSDSPTSQEGQPATAAGGATEDAGPQAKAPVRNFNSNTAAEHPLVKQAMELFGAKIVDVQPRKG